jgi:hypothetical protein
MIKAFLKKYIGFFLFAGLLLVGLNTYKSYGVSWDEADERNLGNATYNYLFHGQDSIKYCSNKIYGVAFELPLTVIEKTLHLQDIRDVYLMRHLMTHLFFLLGALAFFLLIDYLYHNKLLATIGFLLLTINPLIYAHSFFNSKDIPFLSMFIISFLATAVAFNKNNLKWYIILGITCALLMNIRIMGVLLIVCIWIFFGLDYWAVKHDKEAKKKMLRYLLIFTCTSFGLLLITWPYLYSNPGQNFIDAFKKLSQWSWDGDVLFWGTVYRSKHLPMYYAISWFCISNPITYLGLGFLGIIYFIIRFIKTPKQFIFDKALRNQALFVFCFVEPLLAVIAFHSVIFDAWRHLYFIYPPFILAGIYGLNYLFKTKLKWPVLIIVITSIGYTGLFMVSNFPHENVYFNEFVNKDPESLRKNFELDYWGNSYKQALEYIAEHDTSKIINVQVMGLVGKENTWLLKPEVRKRIHITADSEAAKATWFASYYRGHPADYEFQNREVFYIKVLNSRIMSVFKMK